MSRRALIVIDVQNDYFPGGVWALPDAERTLPNIVRLVARAREAGTPLVFVQHVTPPDGPVFAEGSWGARLRDELGVRADDTLIRKHHPSAFQATGLHEFLREAEITDVDVCGYMTQMCCDTTTREAYARGYNVRFFADATAARDLTVDGETIPHDAVHKVTLGALARFARIVRTDEAQ